MKAKLLILSTIVLFNTGCMMQTTTKSEAFTEMYNEKPTSVLVIPAINHSTAADAPDLYSSTINEPLSNAGYYVLPMELTDRFLRNEGLSEGEVIKNVPAQKFAEFFGADAVLYVTIEKWDTNYYVIGGNVTVGADFQMKSCKTGETLWTYKNEMVLDTSGNNNNGGGLLAALISTAIATATQDYVPVARNVNVLSLQAIPFGKYHKLHGKDQTVAIDASKITK